MQTLTVSVSDELALQLQPYNQYLDTILQAGLREIRLTQSLALFKQGNMSVWKAARFAGVTLREMIQYLALNGVEPEVDDEMIEAEIR